jgi:uncharacterized protein
MRISTAVLALFVGLLVLASPSLARAFVVPPIEGHVTDLTRTLDEGQKTTLERQMEAVNQATTIEIAVLVLPSLGGETIEDVAFKTFNTWKLGKADVNNGALLVVATGERRTRIEVGKGLEQKLTEPVTHDILERAVGPELAKGRLFEGLQAGTAAIAGSATGQLAFPPRASARESSGVPLYFVIPGLALLMSFSYILGRVLKNRSAGRAGASGQSAAYPGGFGTGAGGGGGGGGGGFSGGGGSSGGSGSSGSF